MTRVLARTLSPSIRVNAIAPGFVFRSDNVSDEEWQRLVKRIPLKRTPTEEEISSALRFLLENAYMTGQTIIVDGGYTLL